MSGHKRATVKISEEEYRRLHQADMERRFKGHRKEEKNLSQTTDLSNALREMEDRQQQLEQALGALGADFDWVGAEMVQDILEQNAHYYESLASRIEETNAGAQDAFSILSQRFAQELEKERERYHLHLQRLSQRLDAYEQREQSKADAARRWLRHSVSFAEFIQKQFDHERFLPGRLSKIVSSLNLAQNNLVQGLYEASVQTSQQVFLQLSELRLELEQRTIEWQTEYARTKSALTQFVSELEMNASVNAFGLEGEELPDQVDLAYWSNGTYRDLLDKSRRLLAILSQEQRSISTDELRRTSSELLPSIRETFEAIIYEARLKALNSQLRMNIAERALQALETQGFKLNASGYADQDMRAAFTANLENPDGSRVSIEVIPAEKTKQDLANELVVITTHPYLKTEQEARLHWQELCRSLREYDLEVSRPEVHATPPRSTSPVQTPSVRNKPLLPSEKNHNVR